MKKEIVIDVEHLTKDYGMGRGIFDVTFTVHKGEVFGFVGTNGSGKTTTIRHIMGFLKAEQGEVKVLDMDAWKDGPKIKEFVEYVPGEIAFPDLNNGITFLKNQAELLGLKNMDYAKKQRLWQHLWQTKIFLSWTSQPLDLTHLCEKLFLK